MREDIFMKEEQEELILGHKDTILSYLNTHEGFYCDDCISKNCDIIPRQTVFQVCTKLHKQGLINRSIETCKFCKGVKKSSSIIDEVKIESFPLTSGQKYSKTSMQVKGRDEISDPNLFVEVALDFDEFDIENTFTKFDSHSLEEILDKDKYLKLFDLCKNNYSGYMEMKLGNFLGTLKEKGDAFYKQFLNAYGDSRYCKFRMSASQFSDRKGIYVFKSNGIIRYIGRVKGEYTFNQRINMGYANISPKNCYIDGQSTNCHINSIINSCKGSINLYILPLDNDEEIINLEKLLINLVNPDWNIQLK